MFKNKFYNYLFIFLIILFLIYFLNKYMINENFDNGTQDLGHLVCTPTTKISTSASKISNIKLSPNPAKKLTIVSFEGENNQIAVIGVYDLSGKLMMSQKVATNNGTNQYRLNVSKLTNQTYAVKISIGNSSTTTMIVVQN